MRNYDLSTSSVALPLMEPHDFQHVSTGCEKPLNCPIKEVSTNGRLGDLDALKSYLDNTINDATEIGLSVTSEYLMGLIDDAIKNAPTVLEATKGRKK